MRSVELGSRTRLRARRWDVVVLGSALPGLIAAVRLAMGRLRVLLVEEEAAARLPMRVREPFFLPGAAAGGVLDACLRALALPLIDRRRLLPDPVSYQVVLPDARIDFGAPTLTSEELVAWGLAKPEAAHGFVRGLAEAAAAERDALLEAPIVRASRLAGLGRGVAGPRLPRHARGLPGEVSQPIPALAPLIEAQVRALVNVATQVAPPEARARLLGGALEGGAWFESPDDSLLGLLRRRFQALHGEIRLLPGRFELVSVDELAGVAPAMSDDVWFGRALVLNAPLGPLTDWLTRPASPAKPKAAPVAAPDFLPPPATLRRRGWVDLKIAREALPEGMARRVIRVGDPAQPLDGANLIRIALFPERQGREAHAIATFALPEDALEHGELEQQVAESVLELMPFARDRVRRVAPLPRPHWDDDLALEDPGPGSGWPGDIDLRLVARPLVYRLPREQAGVLGVEGDCLLGWRAGEAILSELG
jgi:hypothetical protein